MSYVLNDKDIVYADLDPSEGVLLHLGTKHYFKLNEPSQVIWKGIQKQLSAEQITQDLCSQFDVSPHDAYQDVEAFFEKLRSERFLTYAPAATLFSVADAKSSKAQAN